VHFTSCFKEDKIKKSEIGGEYSGFESCEKYIQKFSPKTQKEGNTRHKRDCSMKIDPKEVLRGRLVNLLKILYPLD
jgi:hypothetical protein